MWERIWRFTYSYLRRFRLFRRILALAIQAYRWFFNLLVEYPIIVVAGFSALAIFIYREPNLLPSILRPRHACKELLVNHPEQFFATSGDVLHLGRTRECESGSPVAIEFYNTTKAPGYLGLTGHIQVSGNILIDGDRTFPKFNGQWQEFSLFGGGNQFSWSNNGNRRYAFTKGGCGFWEEPENRIGTEVRAGLSILSDPRSDPSQSKDQWQHCNFGTPTSPGFESCKWVKFEIFVPQAQLEASCLERSRGERWRFSGLIERSFVGNDQLQTLRQIGRKHWQGTDFHETTIPFSQFESLLTGTPILCMRSVNLDGSPRGGQEQWQTFGKVAKLYCDY